MEQNNMQSIVAQYLKPIYNFAYRLSGNAEDAQDITQEVFIKVWKNIKKYNPSQSFKAWIFAIARNTTIDWLRKRKNLVFSDFENEDGSNFLENTTADEAPLSDELFAKKEGQKMLEEILQQIPIEYRTIIILHDIEDLTFEEIAKVVKKPMNTVKSQHRRAMQALRKYLAVAPK